jgi:hypothetical protein
MFMRLLLASSLLLITCHAYSEEPSAQQRLIQSVAAGEDAIGSIPFSEVLRATTGRRILPFDPDKDGVAHSISDAVAAALSTALGQANAASSPLKKKGRINETSRWFEDKLQALLAATPGFTCDFPHTEAGKMQRSGYPDLRLVHTESGRVAYLDPKVYEQHSEASTLRTFYYEPAGATGKILDDAHHLLLGIAHDGKSGDWTFLRWSMVDVSLLTVRLKAEFHAGNKDIYKPGMIRAKGEPVK